MMELLMIFAHEAWSLSSSVSEAGPRLEVMVDRSLLHPCRPACCICSGLKKAYDPDPVPGQHFRQWNRPCTSPTGLDWFLTGFLDYYPCNTPPC